MSNQRIYVAVPNVAFHKIVRNYAFERGQPIFTIIQAHAALIQYCWFAQERN